MENLGWIKEEELATINSFQNNMSQLIGEVGMLEARKYSLLSLLADLTEKSEEFKKELSSTYGDINIDLKDGSYTHVEKESVTELIE